MENAVQCKDCVHYNTSGCMPQGLGWCECIGTGTMDDYYCCHGKKKEGKENG